MKGNKNSTLLSCMGNLQRLFFVALLAVLAIGATAQNKTVSGTVLDKAGESVIGASVLVKGTTNGTISTVNSPSRTFRPAEPLKSVSSVTRR